MSRRASIVTCTCGMLLRATSLIVPRRERLDWLAEWRGELHHVLGCDVTDRDCIAFSLGAVPDAFWSGRHSLRRGWLPQLESSAACLAFLAMLAVAGVSLAMYLPQVRQKIFSAAYDGPPEINFLLALLVTCLMLPAVLPIFLRAGLSTERLSPTMRTKGWTFVGAKITLLLPLLFCGPVVLGQALAGSRAFGNVLQTFATIGGALFAAFWVIDDQLQRCPSCLRRLTNPARVGERSRSFLNFSGIEYVCIEGHGLLHVPDFPTSWFNEQRWLTLDRSWQSLFQHGIP